MLRCEPSYSHFFWKHEKIKIKKNEKLHNVLILIVLFNAYFMQFIVDRKLFCLKHAGIIRNDIMISNYFHSDLSKPLSELGLFDRQALIVVPHQQGTGHLRGISSLSDQTDSRTIVNAPDGSNGSYFSLVKRVLSFINPFSYFGVSASSSSSGEQSQNGMWQYSEFSAPTAKPKCLLHSC